MSDQTARARLESLAFVPTGTTPEELARAQREASALWAPVVALRLQAGINNTAMPMLNAIENIFVRKMDIRA